MTDNELFESFQKWQSEQQNKAEAERKKRERLEAWQLQREVDQRIMEGVEKGQTWLEFAHSSGMPFELREHYLELQQKSGIAPGSRSNKTDADFLEGFKRGAY